MKYFTVFILVFLLPLQSVASRKPLEKLSVAPYLSAIAVDAESGEVFFEKNADALAWPASVLKLMTLYIVLDTVKSGKIALDDMVQVTNEAARMGGSQVYLDPKEQFTVEDLLYALMVQSANDAAVALATHVAGSKEAFVALMNEKAKQLGMKKSRFYSVHGLPPSAGQEVDVVTARDLVLLCRELVKNPQTFPFTSAVERDFRNGQFVMRTHNHLLENLAGCDGLKTGYFSAAGFSIAATAKRDGKRVIAIVLGSEDRKVRDAKARELIEKGFAALLSAAGEKKEEVAEKKDAAVGVAEKKAATGDGGAGGAVRILSSTTMALDGTDNAAEKVVARELQQGGCWKLFFAGFGCGAVLCLLLAVLLGRRKKRTLYRYTR